MVLPSGSVVARVNRILLSNLVTALGSGLSSPCLGKSYQRSDDSHSSNCCTGTIDHMDSPLLILISRVRLVVQDVEDDLQLILHIIQNYLPPCCVTLTLAVCSVVEKVTRPVRSSPVILAHFYGDDVTRDEPNFVFGSSQVTLLATQTPLFAPYRLLFVSFRHLVRCLANSSYETLKSASSVLLLHEATIKASNSSPRLAQLCTLSIPKPCSILLICSNLNSTYLSASYHFSPILQKNNTSKLNHYGVS